MSLRISNFDCIPYTFEKIVPKGGSSIKVAGTLGEISEYWVTFSTLSVYRVYLEGVKLKPILCINIGEKTVSFILRGTGTVVFLPYLKFDTEEFVEERDDDAYWTSKAISLGKQFVQLIVGMDKSFRSRVEKSPTPDWAAKEIFLLDAEKVLRGRFSELTREIEKIESERTSCSVKLEDHGILRDLLFEKGKPLERAIRHALTVIGFETSHYDEGDNEFDVVFTSQEGRFIGETEGKDSSAINITKLRQLEQTIQEDYARDEIEEFAHGVLFGNAHRITTINKRSDYFTTKCLNNAVRSGIALVRTPDLFAVAKHVADTGDLDFAKKCRDAILKHKGTIAKFPKPRKTTRATKHT